MAKKGGASAQNVGEIRYDVTLDTSKMIDGQRQVDRELKNTTGSLDAFKARLAPIAAAISVMAAALAALKIARTADEFRLLSARVDVAAGSIEAGAVAFSSLVEISRRTQSSLAGNIEVFNRLNQSILQMGGTQADALQVTELLAKAIKVSGASATEAKSAMIQFGQALGSGRLQGDELRSLMENAPYLMRQLADGIGVPIGALKKLGEEGKLTADVVTNAMTKASAQIDADFKKFPQTIESAMVVAQDAAGLAALKFDELTGSSATLTGMAKGLGEVLEKLGDQFGAANEQAGALGRNDQVKTWAGATRTALSYVVDAADVVWQTLSVLGRNVSFVFASVGAEIGGIGAQIAAVARGDFAGAIAIGDAMKEDAARRRAELDAADAKTLADRKLFGQQMREAWEQGAGAGRGSINPSAPASKLKSTAPPEEKKAKFDQAAYLSSLRAAQASEMQVINETEIEKLRVAKKYLDEKKINEAAYVEAVTLIYQTAEEDRLALMQKTQEKIDKQRERDDDQAARDQRDKQDRQGYAKQIVASGDPVAAIREEEEHKVAVLEEYRKLDLANTQLYEDAKREIHRQAAEQIQDIQAATLMNSLDTASSGFAAITSVMRDSKGEQDSLFKASFAAQKAFSIASAIVAIQLGLAKASSEEWPLNLAAMGSVLGATGSIVSTIKGQNYGGGRQYGGPVTSGSLYRVNEGGRPEMFTAANGSQYMMPTANGNVTPAGQVGGGGGQAPTVIIQNLGPPLEVQSQKYDDQANTVTLAVAQVAEQIANNSGKVWNAMRQSTNVQSRL